MSHGWYPLALLLAVGGAGCVGDDGLRFEYGGMKVIDLNWYYVSLQATFRVHNPDPTQVWFRGINSTMVLDGGEVDLGGWSLYYLGPHRRGLAFQFEYPSLYEEFGTPDRGLDALDFELTGTAGFTTPWGPIDLPFDGEGSFPAPRRPTIVIRSLEIEEFDLAGIDLTVVADVDNDMGVPIRISDLQYTVRLDGETVGKGVTELDVDGPGTSVLSMPVTVEAGTIPWALFDRLRTGTGVVDLEVEGNADVAFWSMELWLPFYSRTRVPLVPAVPSLPDGARARRLIVGKTGER